METSIALGMLCYENDDWIPASKYFTKAISSAKLIGNSYIVDICSCNLGIVDANLKFIEVQSQIIERCKSVKKII